MNRKLPFLDFDAQSSSPQYLENLATGYWFSEVLFTSVEMDLFSQLEPDGAALEDLAASLDVNPAALYRFLHALVSVGLITRHNDRYFNAGISHDYLVPGKEHYQGNAILWKKYLRTHWEGLTDCLKSGGRTNYSNQDDSVVRSGRIRKYISAMDCIARTKGQEILRFFEGLSIKGNLIDIGAGSGAIAAAFLMQYPDLSGTFLDLPEVLDYTKIFMREKAFNSKAHYCAGNILETWPVKMGSFDLVILSNIIHAYSEKELPHIIAMAVNALNKEGILLIHDFFFEHYPEKAALSDLNMFINTFNGKVFSGAAIQERLHGLGLSNTTLIPLETDTAIIVASGNASAIRSLHVDPVSRLISKTQTMGFSKVRLLKTEDITVAEWAALKCRYGCDRYGSPSCPPNSPEPEKTRSILKEYRHALLLEGQPPTRDFQQRVLQVEKEAFVSGFPKAFSFWAGPCSLCDPCVGAGGKCRNIADARPSMEGAGIDVFETARLAGARLRTLKNKTDFIKYYGLILLE
ncbi:MAG: methyltransferase domain-containing protein [Nitrospirae bacterium]|nr:methyltransferase domain-containing protein [Nitrospirota bacterium]